MRRYLLISNSKFHFSIDFALVQKFSLFLKFANCILKMANIPNETFRFSLGPLRHSSRNSINSNMILQTKLMFSNLSYICFPLQKLLELSIKPEQIFIEIYKKFTNFSRNLEIFSTLFGPALQVSISMIKRWLWYIIGHR